MDKETFNKNQKARRAALKEQGICVDCQDQPVKPAERGKPPHVCCAFCLEARRNRWKTSAPAVASIGRLL
jgi:hypothetical protein